LPLKDQVAENANIRSQDQDYDPESLDPAGNIVAVEIGRWRLL
jgi:hypothetical protein